MSTDVLNPAKALIFRITHLDNIPWILQHGLHCSNSLVIDDNYVDIGNPELIGKRRNRVVPRDPGGTLSDYIPFYFTPFSPMLFNIKTGYGGIRRRANREIAIVVSSLHKLLEFQVPFLFTDRHAYLAAAQFFATPEDLDKIDWNILQQRDFRRDHEDPDKFEKYQAEALVYKHLPLSSCLGIVCYHQTIASQLEARMRQHGHSLRVVAKPRWYF